MNEETFLQKEKDNFSVLLNKVGDTEIRKDLS